MPTLKIICLFSALALSSLSFAQDWFEFTSSEDHFTINMPVEPSVEEISWPSEYGAVFPGRLYTSESGDRAYAVTVIDYKNALEVHKARTNTTAADGPVNYQYWRIDVIASVAYAATQFRNRGSEVTYDAWHHIERVYGHQLNLTNPDNSRSYVGIYLHKDRLYIVEATVPDGSPPQGHFQQSLGFNDEDGVRIRYQWLDDGSLVREESPNA
jgi:hypothetical protein|tara:strand:- start:43476 stop:44111 length:636 start_codon:yes stop_codon:yes gene_type:complete